MERKNAQQRYQGEPAPTQRCHKTKQRQGESKKPQVQDQPGALGGERLQASEWQHRKYKGGRVGRKTHQAVPHSQVIVLALKPGPLVDAVERNVAMVKCSGQIV